MKTLLRSAIFTLAIVGSLAAVTCNQQGVADQRHPDPTAPDSRYPSFQLQGVSKGSLAN